MLAFDFNSRELKEIENIVNSKGLMTFCGSGISDIHGTEIHEGHLVLCDIDGLTHISDVYFDKGLFWVDLHGVGHQLQNVRKIEILGHTTTHILNGTQVILGGNYANN